MLDEDATNEKELRIQIELYRVLKNYIIQDLSIVERVLDDWIPSDVLFEASILRDSKTPWEADLVLMASTNRSAETNRQPILVIETKKRKTSRVTQYYQAALRQARKYAYAIKCPTYAVYDGHTLILMRDSSPYLMGLTRWVPTENERSNRDFARKLWGVSRILKDAPPDYRPNKFIFHPDFDPWRGAIFYFIRDALQFRIEVIQGMSPQDYNIDGEAESLADIYRGMFRRY